MSDADTSRMVQGPAKRIDYAMDSLNKLDKSIDRHQGWYTEEKDGHSAQGSAAKRPTDYIVRTTYTKESFESPETEEKSRIQLILRFRSMLTRRGKSLFTIVDRRPRQTHSFQRSTRFLGSLAKQLSHMGRKIEDTLPAKPFDAFASMHSTRILHCYSDSCLLQPKCSLHLRGVTGHVYVDQWDASKTNSNQIYYRNFGAKPPDSFLNKNNKMHSLSTGNVCCMYALRCVPSVEFYSITSKSEPTVLRRHSLPVSSLKSDRKSSKTTHLDEPSLSSLKNSFCYKDAKTDLTDWLKHTMDTLETHQPELSDSSLNVRNESFEFNSNLAEWSRHVRFADEANRSISGTTLNSLSASSSMRSLTSLSQFTMLNPACESPPQPHYLLAQQCPVQLRSSLRDPAKKTSRSVSVQHVTVKDNEIIDSTKTSTSKSFSLAQRLWKRKKSKPKKGAKVIPLVTVNVIQDYEEPPEVPMQAFKELNLQEFQPHWEKTFVNPADCANFQKRLSKQGVCLGRLWPIDMNSVGVEVHFISNKPRTGNEAASVSLRYTLDSWETHSESRTLSRSHFERHNPRVYDDKWVEVYAGTIVLTDKQRISTHRRLEFAVVARSDGENFWDNNNKENYLCLWRTEEY